jgi:hypothetical protein
VGAVLGKITASGKYTALDPDAVDGSEVAAAVLLHAVDASAADVDTVAVVRHCLLVLQELEFEAGVDAGEQTTAIGELEAAGMIVRQGA